MVLAARRFRWEGVDISTVLVLDKDPLQLQLTSVLLQRDNHKALTAADPDAALATLNEDEVDLMIVETSMPRHDGYRLGQQIRQLKPHLPVIVLSEVRDDEYIVRSLLAFADDYMVKPFSPRELLARVHAQLRRAGATHVRRSYDGSVVVGDMSLNLHQMQVRIGSTLVALTPRELSLLSALMMNPNRVLARSQLVRLAWGDDFDGCLKTVDVCVQRLRKKIQPHLREDYIEAVRGFGYKLQHPGGSRAQQQAAVARPLAAVAGSA